MTRPNVNPIRKTRRKRGERTRKRISFSIRTARGSRKNREGRRKNFSTRPSRRVGGIQVAEAACASKRRDVRNCQNPKTAAARAQPRRMAKDCSIDLRSIRLAVADQGQPSQESPNKARRPL